jgi:hypothetical protein
MDTTWCPDCGAVAEVTGRHVLESTEGPIEHARIACGRRHQFLLPFEWLDRQPRRGCRPGVR